MDYLHILASVHKVTMDFSFIFYFIKHSIFQKMKNYVKKKRYFFTKLPHQSTAHTKYIYPVKCRCFLAKKKIASENHAV